MAFDEGLARRVRRHAGRREGIAEKKMFGCLAFLLHGNMCCGVHGEGLIVRVDPAQREAALVEPGARPFDLTGRPMKGWLLVNGAALKGEAVLPRWVRRGLDFAATLPRR
jgi:hypothetical protein